MSLRRLSMVAGAALAIAACCGPGPSAPRLDGDERRLVDLYVRIAVLERLHAEKPDSAEAGFERLGRSFDSTAVRSTLDKLGADPVRWERVYEAIAKRLKELEERSPNPSRQLQAQEEER